MNSSLIRMMIAGMIEELGYIVVAEAGNLNDALNLARMADFEIAVLDINLGGERIGPVADVIAGRCLHFIFASGYDAAVAPEKFRDRNMPRPSPFMQALNELSISLELTRLHRPALGTS